MNKRFTKLIAALALLVFMTPSLVAWGQTTVSYGWETSDDATQWTITDAIVATSGQGNTGDYAGMINTNHTYVQFNEKVYVTSFSFAFKRTSTNSNYNVYIETSTDGDTWTAVETYAMNTFTNGSYSTKSHTFDGSVQYYVRFHCYNTTAVRYVDDVTITYSDSGTSLEASDLSLSPTALEFDLYDDYDAKTITITTSSEGEITVSDNEYVTTEVSGNIITVTPGENITQETQTITVSQASDGIYASGTATFTVDIADSTPFTGGDVTFDAAVDKGTNSSGSGSITKSVVTFACTSCNLSDGQAYRLYSGSTTTISTTYGTITGIAFTMASGYASTLLSTTTGNYSEGTWTGNAESVSFSASAQARVTQIVVTVTAPASVATPTFSPEAGVYTTTQNVEISCETEDATIYYTTNGDTPTVESTEYTGPIEVSATTTIKAIAVLDGENSYVGEATYTIVTIEHAGTEADPYTVADARAIIDIANGETVEGKYATGIVSRRYSNSVNSNGQISYYISDDGTTTNELEAYNGLGLNGEQFTSVDDIQVGDIVIIYGNLKKYNTTYEFDANNYLVSLVHPVVPSIEAEATLALAYDATSGEIEYSITNPVEGQSLTASSTADWISDITVGESAVTFTTTVNEGTEDRTATVTLSYDGAESVTVTVTQGHYSAPGNWVLTNLEDLTAGDVFVIVGNNGDNYAMKHTDATSSAPTVVAVTVAENTLSGTIDENIQWNLTVSSDGYTFYPAGSATTWLYCISNNNGLRVSAGNYPKVFIMKDDYLYNVGQGRYVGIYNSQDWRSYTSINNNIANQTFAFYKKVSDNVTYTKAVTAYEGEGGYVLIASPVCSVTPSADNGFLTSEYDLYAFDQAEADEWRNYKASSFNLVSGKGYLYASSTATTLTFVGQPYNGNGLVTLDYTEGADFAGWNLIGNPYATAATLSQPFYRLTNGSEVSAESETGSVNAMEGVFVVATEAGQTVTFSTENNAKAVEQVVMNVTRNRGTAIDRAIVRFDEGQQLPKFQLNPENTKLYIAQGNKDYAIVRSAAQGEMPVSFRAAENGTYTLAVETENVEMNYLHLIDNMTGMDVDLLATPNYTFEARKNDYASRFRLVFSANGIDEQNAETFAYFNGSEWMVSNLGEATLQVVDVMGRVLSTETISGNAELSLNQPAGVYMLRLINGNDVKVQKVVVR